MPAPAENALELSPASLDDNRQILVNHEINATCRFTRICGDTCILAHTNSAAAEPLSGEIVVETGIELAAGASAEAIRHYCMAGKEPFETPDRVLSIARAWHQKPAAKRAGTIGAISSCATGIRDVAATMADSAPLSWILASMDVAATHLRSVSNNEPLISALRYSRNIGAVQHFGINTLLTNSNLEDVVNVGRAVCQAGADQWSVGTLMVPRNGSMALAVSLPTIRGFIDRLLVEPQFCEGSMRVTIDLDYSTFVSIAGIDVTRDSAYKWRFEEPIAKNISIISLNPIPGRFLRVRWDGEMLSMKDFMTLGLSTGMYGNCVGKSVSDVIETFVDEAPIAVGAAVAGQ